MVSSVFAKSENGDGINKGKRFLTTGKKSDAKRGSDHGS